MDEAKLRASLEGLEVREALFLGESVRLADPKDPEVSGVAWRDTARQGKAARQGTNPLREHMRLLSV